MGKPSDAAIAAAFWQSRKFLNEMPTTLMGDKERAVIQYGNDLVASARLFEWHEKFIADAMGLTTHNQEAGHGR